MDFRTIRLGWATDIHLPRAKPEERDRFLGRLAATAADLWVITGDIGHARSLEQDLLALADAVPAPAPIYFVLGNHDFYGGDIATVRRLVTALGERGAGNGRLRWLPAVGPVDLAPRTILLGHDGWADCRLGNVDTTPLVLNDFRYIVGLDGTVSSRIGHMRALADQAAASVRSQLAAAFAPGRTAARSWSPSTVIVATHVPPFAESATLKRGPAPPDFLPYFCSKAMGDVLLEAAGQRPDVRFVVLCGHTHGVGMVEMRENLTVLTGGAEYGHPEVQAVFELGPAE